MTQMKRKRNQQSITCKLEEDLSIVLITILNQIVSQNLGKQYNYHKFPAPWMQIKLLRILGLIGRVSKEESQNMYEVIRDTMKKAGKHDSYVAKAIVVECIRTITVIHPCSYLIELASKAVSKMFMSSTTDNSVRYIAIDTIRLLIHVNPQYAIEFHQDDIIDCLESPDFYMRLNTVRTLYKMANPTNIKVVIEELLKLLEQAVDDCLIRELVTNIMSLTEKHTPDPLYYIEIINRLFNVCELEYIEERHIQKVIALITDAGRYVEDGEDFLSNCIQLYHQLCEADRLPDEHEVQLITWILGEYSYLMNSKSSSLQNLGPDAAINEPSGDSITTDSCMEHLLHFLNGKYEREDTRARIVSSIQKLYTRMCESGEVMEESMSRLISTLLENAAESRNTDLSQRSSEFLVLQEHPDVLQRILPKGNSVQVQVDSKLSFLSGFVTQEFEKGAKPYDPLAKIELSDNETAALKFIHHEAKIDEIQEEVRAEEVVAKTDKKWTEEGYMEGNEQRIHVEEQLSEKQSEPKRKLFQGLKKKLKK